MCPGDSDTRHLQECLKCCVKFDILPPVGWGRGGGGAGSEGEQEPVADINHRRVIGSGNKVSVIGLAIGILRGGGVKKRAPCEEFRGNGASLGELLY